MAELQIVFQDDHLLVISKPAGIVVNRAKSVRGETIQDWAEEKLKTQNSKFKTLKTRNSNLETNQDWDAVNRQAYFDRSGIVHRLDKETSGILVIAKTPDAFVNLLRQFRERKVKKTYLALVHGNLETSKPGNFEIINAPLGRLPWNRTRFGVFPSGRKAVTKYHALRSFQLTSPLPSPDWRGRQGKIFTLLELYPLTGRTHQLRVHLKHIGHPIVGDPLYAGRKTARSDRKWCPRLFLHAYALELTHPCTGKHFQFTTELPEDLSDVISTLSRA